MHLVFYSDSPICGGHEITVEGIAKYIVGHSNHVLTFVVNESNSRLMERLGSFEHRDRLHVVKTRLSSGSMQGIRSLLSPRAIAEAKRLRQELNPDLLMIAQGSIEMATTMLLASRDASCPVVSYIPYAHTFAETTSYVGVFRDLINPYFYRIPNAYITNAPSCEKDLRDRGVKNPIAVVPPIAGFRDSTEDGDKMLRLEWHLSQEEKAVAIVARIDLKHKGHGVMIDALKKHRDKLADVRLIIVGDGDDLDRCKEMVQEARLTDRVTFAGHLSNVADMYGMLSALVIPSSYEGMPLVMIEAMHSSVPIVATNRDGMADMLPSEWLFPYGDIDALADKLRKVLDSPDKTIIRRNKEIAQRDFTLAAAGERFLTALEKFAGKTNTPSQTAATR